MILFTMDTSKFATKEDIKGVKEDISRVKADVKGLKADIKVLRGEILRVEERV